MMPFSGSTFVSGFTLPERETGGKPTQARATEYRVTAGYAEALGLRLREGRFFQSDDLRPTASAVLVNEEFARLFLSAGPIAGRHFEGGFGSTRLPTDIVGVVRNVLKDGLDAAPQPEMFLPLRPGTSLRREIDLVIRTAGDPAAVGCRCAMPWWSARSR
jgi:hypothetical protein